MRHLGVDSRFWAGHYGPKICRTCIKLLPPNASIEPNSVTTEEYHAMNTAHGYDLSDDDDDDDEFDDFVETDDSSETD